MSRDAQPQAFCPAPARLDDLLAGYDALLLDAYGVLVDKQGALPGAAAFISRLNRRGTPYFLLTNASSRLPEGIAEVFRDFGLDIPAARILTSGQLLGPYFRAHGLVGKRCIVLGPEDAYPYVTQAGGVVVDPQGDAEVVVIADQAGYPLLEGLDAVLSLAIRRLDAGLPLHLLLPNPDLLYPHGPGRYGLTSGALGAMLEHVLRERYPDSPPRCARLGKPYPPIFEEAARRAGTRKLLMFGDQLATDILGAQRFGIDSVLVRTGVSRTFGGAGICPTYVLPGLDG